MTGQYIVCEIKEHTPINGADKIVSSNIFGETVIISKETPIGTKGILIDLEAVLDKNLVSNLNMFRDPKLNQDKVSKGYIEENCRVRPISLKGTKCSGLFLSEEQLYKLGINLPKLGTEGTSIDDIKICEKYIAKATRSAMNSNKGGSVRQNLVPTFKEHVDSDQWARNSHKVQEGDLVIITEKLHGTSGRCGYLPVDTTTRIPKWKLFLDKLLWGKKAFYRSYEFVVGSRRVVKSIGGNEAENKQHFYDEDLWTKIAKEKFEHKLRKGETVYFEIVGYTLSGELIMPSVSNKKLEKFMDKKEYKEFVDKYGDVTTFSYGCDNSILDEVLGSKYKIFVYRITLTNEDGDSVDYSWEQVKRRCEQLGVNHVPELLKTLFGQQTNDINLINKFVEELTDSESKNFPQHIREGVCIRVENGNMIPLFLKNKSFIFKVLEGIIKDNNVVDLEESQG